jgi:predicted MFS family arabinose efflux permease
MILMPVNFILGIDRNALSISSPLVQADLHVTYVTMSEILVFSTAVYAVLQIPAGRLVQRIGVRVALSAACLLWSAATLLTAFQTHPAGFFLARLLLGIGQAPDWVACIFALRLLFHEKERELASSLLLGGLYIGYSASGVLTASVIRSVGWRDCFIVYGMVGLVAGMLTIILYRGAVRMSPAEIAQSPETSDNPMDWGRIAQIVLFYLCCCFFLGFFHVTFPHFLLVRFHVDPMMAARLYSVPWSTLYLAVVGFGLGFGFLRKRYGVLKDRTLSLFRVGGVLGAAGCCGLGIWEHSLTGSLCFFVGGMVFLGLCQVLTWSYVQSFGVSTGVVAGATSLAGNVATSVGPVLTAELLDHGFGWGSVAVLTLAVGVAAALSCRTMRSAES